MTSVFRLHPNELEKKLRFIGLQPKEYYSYNFLNIIQKKYNININIYYEMINSLELFKLKNIFYFMNIRLSKINIRLNYSNNITSTNFNDILNEFINNNIVNAIIIMNLLQHYIYPSRNI